MVFKCVFLVLLLVVIATLGVGVEAKRRHRGHLPIDHPEDEEPGEFGPHDEKRKASECRFGDKHYELEQTWNPDLGPPFGVMYCIHCECVPIHKKRRIVGRVRCKNIRAECPSPTCGSPVLLPGRCCKVCPGQENNPDEKISVDLAREEEEKNSRHYGSLLTSESMPKPSLVATGRFYFRKKTLSYSFVTGQEFGHPKFISFLDENGNIVEEFLTQTNEFHNITGKICGSWNRLPRRYRRQLRKDLLFAQLTNAEGATISGRIGKHFGLSSEYFSGLLLPISGSGFGSATAIVSTDSTSSTAGGVHIMILMKDVFGPTDDQDVTLDVKLEAVMDNGERRIIEDTLRVPKVVPKDATTSDLKTGFDVLEMDALGRGNLKMTVSSRNFPHYGVEGYLGSRFSCDLVDSILSPVDEDSELDEIAAMDHQNSPQRGLAWLVPKTNGELDYHIQIEDLSSNEITALQIDNGKMSRRLLMTIPLKATFNGGEASGSIRISAKEMEQLFKDNLFLNVATLANERALRGKLTIQMMSEATETIRPILLKSNLSLVSGIAWTSINAHCRLNYEMRLIGPERKTESTLTLKDFPMKNLKNLAMMPGRQLALQTFRGPTVSGHQDNLHKLSVARLDGGDASFVIRHEGHYEFADYDVMTAGASETHNSNSSLDNSATDRYGMASVSSSNQYEIPHELQEVLLDFTVQYLIERPDDLTEFAFHYFSRLKRKKNQELDHQSDESMVSEDEQDEDQMAAYQARARRKSVFAEAYNPEEDEDDDKQVILHPKTDTQRRTLNAAVANILLFRSLDQEQKTEVIDAMFEKDVTAGENVITQGADGDNFYIIERGFFGIYVEIDGVDKQVGNYDNTGSFGELALMYNMPRAATIKAITDGVLWAMDRTTFRRIVLKSAFQKRKMYETLLESVHILKSLSSYERMNLADALVSKTFENGKTIMRQGDNADGMYFVEDGEVIVRMTGEDDLDREIKVISKGGYFGELGLLNQQLRAASILAKGKVKVAFLDKQAFERLLGPCMDVMKERTEDYQEELEKIFQSTAAISNTH